MGIPKEKFDQVFQQLPKKYQENVFDYMEYLLEKAAKAAWSAIPEIDEPLNEEEIDALKSEREYYTSEEAKREFDLHVDLP
jgi:hypothetical protein